jgi:hypothetical protein
MAPKKRRRSRSRSGSPRRGKAPRRLNLTASQMQTKPRSRSPSPAPEGKGKGEGRDASVKTGLAGICLDPLLRAWIERSVKHMTNLHVLYSLFVAIFIVAGLPASLAVADASQYPSAICGPDGVGNGTWHLHAAKVSAGRGRNAPSPPVPVGHWHRFAPPALRAPRRPSRCAGPARLQPAAAPLACAGPAPRRGAPSAPAAASRQFSLFSPQALCSGVTHTTIYANICTVRDTIWSAILPPGHEPVPYKEIGHERNTTRRPSGCRTCAPTSSRTSPRGSMTGAGCRCAALQ